MTPLLCNVLLLEVEKELELWQHPLHRKQLSTGIPDAVSRASVTVAREMGAAAIVSLTRSGSTAQMVSKHRPPCLIIGATPVVRTWRAFSLLPVEPLLVENIKDQDEAVANAFTASFKRTSQGRGSRCSNSRGPYGHSWNDEYATGSYSKRNSSERPFPLEEKEAFGVIKAARTAEEALGKMEGNHILVVSETDRDFLPAMRERLLLLLRNMAG